MFLQHQPHKYLILDQLCNVIFSVLGHFLLTNLLLDHLKSSAPSRVVMVAADLYVYGKIDFDDLFGKKDFTTMTGYKISKLAVVLFCAELAERLKGKIS